MVKIHISFFSSFYLAMMERTTIKNAKGEEELMTYVHAIVVPKDGGDALMPTSSNSAKKEHLITEELIQSSIQ